MARIVTNRIRQRIAELLKEEASVGGLFTGEGMHPDRYSDVVVAIADELTQDGTLKGDTLVFREGGTIEIDTRKGKERNG